MPAPFPHVLQQSACVKVLHQDDDDGHFFLLSLAFARSWFSVLQALFFNTEAILLVPGVSYTLLV